MDKISTPKIIHMENPKDTSLDIKRLATSCGNQFEHFINGIYLVMHSFSFPHHSPLMYFLLFCDVNEMAIYHKQI
jgi:hypothetical protein